MADAKPKTPLQGPGSSDASDTSTEAAPKKSEQRFVTYPNGRRYPVEFSRRNRRTGIIYDYVRQTRSSIREVVNENGIAEKKKVEVFYYDKIGRAPEKTDKPKPGVSSELVEV